jgi:penicillin-binding protein 2
MNKKVNREIEPDEIFLDAHNLPQFDTHQFEGRLDKPISRLVTGLVVAFFILVLMVYAGKVWSLQVVRGDEYRTRSENNRLNQVPVFAARGVIRDRNGVELAWNAPGETDNPEVPDREYSKLPGLAHVLGYVSYPTKDSNGFYYQEDFQGVSGVEKFFDEKLRGNNGTKLIEVDARGVIRSSNQAKQPEPGDEITLSIDSRVQSALFNSIKGVAERVGFAGGAGVMMNVNTGEIIALTSYPEYSGEVMSAKRDKSAVSSLLSDSRKPFLNRVTDGLYTPGSIVKPFVAFGALTENTIDPTTNIVSTGSISVPNEYDPKIISVFRDWKAHGAVDMRKALAVSSDVYFYVVGGGYKDQKGLGITKMDEYFRLFGLGEASGSEFFGEEEGVIPTPAWKLETFDESWRLGNTYHTAIGQYGFQVTPLQIVRAISAIANEGSLIAPTIEKTERSPVVLRSIEAPSRSFSIVREGMRKAVTEGTSVSLNVPFVTMAAKSGTAELGTAKETVNSWMTGFFPYENPQYAFAVILEKGSVHNLIGAGAAMRETLDWMSVNTPEYFTK